MAKIWPWPQSGHEDTSTFTGDSRNKSGSLYLMDDGGVWRYGRNTNGAALAANELVKKDAADWEFKDTAAGDEGKAPPQLHVCPGAPADDDYGWFAWYNPSISIKFDAVAVAAGLPITCGAAANTAKAVAAATAPKIGVTNAAVPTAGTATACSFGPN